MQEFPQIVISFFFESSKIIYKTEIWPKIKECKTR